MQQAPVIYQAKQPVPLLHSFEAFAGTYVIGGLQPPEVHLRRAVLGSHGAGVLRGRLIAGVNDAAAVLAEASSVELVTLGQEMRGSLTLYIHEPAARELTILPDPLGGGLVFTFQDRDGWAASSDLAALTSVLGMLGKSPRKSFAYVASYVATGSGGIVESSYENIGTLPQFSYVTVRPGSVEVLEYPAKASFFASDMTYDESLDQIRGEVMENIGALAGAPHNRKVAHLTGGIDSRVVLSAILGSGRGHDFAFYCAGGPTEPDQVIARRLSAEHGLTMTEHPGVESETSPVSLSEQLLFPFQQTAGIISGPAQSGMRASSHSIASGGYGELFRSFYNRGQVFAGDAAEAAEHMYGQLGFSSDPKRRILADSFVRTASGSLAAIMNAASLSGARDDALMDFVYMNRRNRYYVGEISRSITPFSTRFDPLYSVAGASLGMRTDGVHRNANVIGVDLIEKMVPGLSHFPFDSDKLGGAYAHVRGRQEIRPFSGAGEPKFDGADKARVTNAGLVETVRPTPADIQRARELRMNPRLVAQFPQIQKGLRELVESVPKDTFAGAFNPATVDRLANRTPSNRIQYRTARDLYAGLLWYIRG